MEVRRIVPPFFTFFSSIANLVNLFLLGSHLISNSLNLFLLLLHKEHEPLLQVPDVSLTFRHRKTLCTTAPAQKTIAKPITTEVIMAGVESKCRNGYF